MSTDLKFARDDVHVQSWYVVCKSSKVSEKLQTFPFLNRKVLVFKSRTGELRALDAHCSHMGVDLSLGDHLETGQIRCPFHHWTYKENGELLSGGRECSTKNLRSFPVVDRFGYIFVFNGATPTFNLPDELPSSEYVQLRAPSSWLKSHFHLVTANGLDAIHFATLHKFQIMNKPQYHFDDHSMALEIEVLPKNKWMRYLFGVHEPIRTKFKAIGGNLAWVEFNKPYQGAIFLANRACPKRGGCETHAILFAKKKHWLETFRMIALNIYLSKDDSKILDSINFNPQGLSPHEPLTHFINLVNRQPEFNS